jgi:hypothetical protein
MNREESAQPEGGGNDEERGHVAVPIGRLWRAPRHASPLSFAGMKSLVIFGAFVAAILLLILAARAGMKSLSDGQRRSFDRMLARNIGMNLTLYSQEHGGQYPDRLDIPEIKRAVPFHDQKTWPFVRYWKPSSLTASNDFVLAWPTRDGWICVRTNSDAEFRRDLPESANQAVLVPRVNPG